jgi:hypothetical protein
MDELDIDEHGLDGDEHEAGPVDEQGLDYRPLSFDSDYEGGHYIAESSDEESSSKDDSDSEHSEYSGSTARPQPICKQLKTK